MRTLIFCLIAGSLLLNSARADHEVDHRYNIRGYVLDANEQGIANLSVNAFLEGEIIGTGKTAADGFYSLHLHLHNEDYHRLVKLRAGTQEAELRITFDAADNTTARIHEANFVGDKFIEGSLGLFRIPSWSYAVAGLLLFMIVMILLERRRKRKIRIAQHGTAEKHAPSGKRAKKARRKKH